MNKMLKRRFEYTYHRYLDILGKTARDIVMSSNKIENVLVLQGGGSLGAFGCGVFKSLTNKNIKIDIVAGTSIGGINAAIIAGSANKEHPERTLEHQSEALMLL